MLPLGTRAPDFSLLDVDSNKVGLSHFAGKSGLLVIFMCNHCPFVIHLRSAIAAFTAEYQAKGLGVVGINSNDAAAYPSDSPELMKAESVNAGYTFPYLFDADQSVAKAYRAACTPDFFLFDKDLSLVYRGQFDDSRPKNGKPITGADLRAAADAVLSNASPLTVQKPSIGCNIKWRPGHEPEYFTGISAVE